MKRTGIGIFVDRDGTIIEDRGHLGDEKDVVFFPDTFEALRRLQERAMLFIVTNQSGVAKGLIRREQADAVNNFVVERLRKEGINIEAVYCCPHSREDNCACIKPNRYFIDEAARQFGITAADSFVIGDHPHDVEFAERAGATGIYVLSGHGRRHAAELPPGKIVVAGIREAADWIISTLAMTELEERKPGVIEAAAGILRNGGVVAFPTETVYGLGASAFDERALARVFEIKQRPKFDPLIVHIHEVEQLDLVAQGMPEDAKKLASHFWPGPLTLVLAKTPHVPDIVTAGLPSVAVRMPRHPLALELIRRAGAPLAAPSANPFGRISPTTAQHVVDQLDGKVDSILDGGPCPIGVESTIVSFVGEEPALLRPGGLPLEDIEAIIGPVKLRSADAPATAPGMMPRHYSPRTPIRVIRESIELDRKQSIGLLRYSNVTSAAGYAAVETLSPTGDQREAAANLFRAMRKLDELKLDLILAEPAPDVGLGRAINDRLTRAEGKG